MAPRGVTRRRATRRGAALGAAARRGVAPTGRGAARRITVRRGARRSLWGVVEPLSKGFIISGGAALGGVALGGEALGAVAGTARRQAARRGVDTHRAAPRAKLQTIGGGAWIRTRRRPYA